MDKRFIDEHDIQRKYLNDQLTPEEAESFEIFLMDNPDMVDQLEIDQIMSEGIREQDNLVATQTPAIVNNLIHFIRRPVPLYVPALAIALLIPFSIGNKGLSSLPDDLTLISYSTEAVRGSATDNEKPFSTTLIKPKTAVGPKAILLKLQPSTVRTFPNFVATLSSRSSSQLLWESTEFSPTALRDKLLLVPDNIDLNDVRLEVFAIDDEDVRISVRFCHYSEVCNDRPN